MGKRNLSWRIIWKFKSKLRNHWQLWEITWRFSRFTWSFGNDAYWLTIKKGIQRKHPTVYSEFLYFFVSEWAPRPLMRRLDISNIPFSFLMSFTLFLPSANYYILEEKGFSMAEILVKSGVSSSEVGQFYFILLSVRNSTIQMLDRMSCVKLPECCFPVFPEYWGAGVSNINKGCPLGSWLSKLCQLAGNREEQ